MLGNYNGTDGQTDRRTDRVRRNMPPPPREEGRITNNFSTCKDTQHFFSFSICCIQSLVIRNKHNNPDKSVTLLRFV